MEKVYGKANVALWADLNNDKDSDEISERIDYMIEQSDAEINGRLGLSAYTVPFAEPPPTIISHLSALSAGLRLFNGRRVVSDEGESQVSTQEKEIENIFNRILSDTLLLPLPRTSTRPIKVVKTPDAAGDIDASPFITNNRTSGR